MLLVNIGYTNTAYVGERYYIDLSDVIVANSIIDVGFGSSPATT
jgi:hypothetical protein